MIVRQASFAVGELAPALHGRTDLPQRDHGLATLRNFLVGPGGELHNRPGSRFVAEGAGAPDIGTARRLLPFIVSPTAAAILELGHYVCAFYVDGQPVMDPINPSERLTIATPWSELQLRELRYLQIGNELYVTRASSSHVAPRVITRIADDSWTIQELSFEVPAYDVLGVQPFIQEPPGGFPVETDTKVPREWTWKCTVLVQAADGTVYESGPATVTEYEQAGPDGRAPVPSEFVLYEDDPIWVQFTGPDLPPPPLGSTFVVGTRIYRGRGSVFGFVGEVLGQQSLSGSYRFKDYGDEPDYARPPPGGRNGLGWYASPTSTAPSYVEAPAAVGLFEQRLVLGGSTEHPTRLWFSRTNDRTNFDPPQVPIADGAVELELAVQRREEIRHILGGPGGRCLVFTDAAVWAVSGSSGSPLSAAELPVAHRQSDRGAGTPPPLVVGDRVLYVGATGRDVRELVWSAERAGAVGGDLAVFSSHLLERYPIVEWAYAREPHSIVWAVRADGKLLSFTFQPETGVAGWALHELEGFVRSVAVIPAPVTEGLEGVLEVPSFDEVWLVVEHDRGTFSQPFVERLAPRVCFTGRAYNFLDASITVTGAWNGTNFDPIASATITGLGHLEGRSVWAAADSQILGPFTVANGEITLAIGNVTLPERLWPRVCHVGLAFESEAELLDVPDAVAARKVTRAALVSVWRSRSFTIAAPDGTTPARRATWRQRTIADSFAPTEPATVNVETPVESSWSLGGRLVIRQSEPAPLSILGVTRVVATGGAS